MGSNEKIVVFGPALPLNIAPMWVAHDKGFFKEEGLDVDLRPVQGIPDSEHPRHQWRKDGEIIFQSPGGSPPFRSVLENRDHIDGEVNVVSIANRTAHVFVAKPYVKDVADLKGRKIAGDLKGGSSMDAKMVMRHFGVDPEKDVTVLALGDSAIRVNALTSGMIQAGAYNLGEAQHLKQQGHKQLLDLALTGVEYQHTAAATTRGFLTRNRRAVVNYTKAIVESMAWMKNHKDESLKLMAKYLRIMDRQVLESQYEENVAKLYVKKPYPTLAGVRTILESQSRNEKAKSMKVEQFVDMSIVRELDETGFIDSVYR